MISNEVKKDILVIDDNEVAQSLITKVLAMGGYRSVIANSSSSALEQLHYGHWACVILELGIPGVGGLELLQIIKKEQPKLPVVVVTDEKKLESAIIAMKYQASNYLLKPVMPRDILNSIGEALRTKKTVSNHQLQNAVIYPEVWISDTNLKYSEVSRRIYSENKSINLTGLESKIIGLLISRDPAVVPTNEIVALSQGYDVTNEEAAQIIRPTISRLNKKLGTVHSEKIRISNVRGVGYYLEKSTIKHPS